MVSDSELDIDHLDLNHRSDFEKGLVKWVEKSPISRGNALCLVPTLVIAAYTYGSGANAKVSSFIMVLIITYINS